MDKLKALFGTDALTFEQLEEKLKDNKEIKLANLAAGGYVDRKKYDDKVAELGTASDTIKGLRDTVAKFDGVDIDKLKNDAANWETKYNDELAALRLDNAVNMALVEAKVKNPKLARAGLDLSIVKMDGDKLIGLSEQLSALKESDSYLFEAEEQKTAQVTTGVTHTNTNTIDSFSASLMRGAGLDEN